MRGSDNVAVMVGGRGGLFIPSLAFEAALAGREWVPEADNGALGGLAYAPADRLEAVLDGLGGGGVEVAPGTRAYGETALGGGAEVFIDSLV
jgi:hypothetical protein